MGVQQKSESEMFQVTWIVLSVVSRLNVGKIKLAQFLKGSKSKDVISISGEQSYGGLFWYDIPTITGFIEQLEIIGLIHKKNFSGSVYDYSVYVLTEAGKKVLEEKQQITLQIIREVEPITVGYSERETFRLLRSGKSVSEIAKERNLVESTIYTHIFRLIVNRYLSSDEVISGDVIKQVYDITRTFKYVPSVKTVKEFLPNISYEEIRCVLADIKY